MLNLSPYQLWQQNKYGNILPPGEGCGQDKDPAEWTELMAELQLKEYENTD